jgi:hypothetical protein
MVRIDIVLFVIVSAFGYIYYIVTVIAVLSRIIKFILTSSVTQSLYCPQITRTVTAKIPDVVIQLRVGYFFSSTASSRRL